MLRSFIIPTVILHSLMLGACAAPAAPHDPPFPAVIQRDCAPWDGPAFTLSIPFDTGRLARISIFQSPNLRRRVTFSFPDPAGRIGSASYRSTVVPWVISAATGEQTGAAGVSNAD